MCIVNSEIVTHLFYCQRPHRIWEPCVLPLQMQSISMLDFVDSWVHLCEFLGEVEVGVVAVVCWYIWKMTEIGRSRIKRFGMLMQSVSKFLTL